LVKLALKLWQQDSIAAIAAITSVCIVDDMVRNVGSNRRGAGRGGNTRRRQQGQPGGAPRDNRASMPNHITLRAASTAPYKFCRSFDLGYMARPSASDEGFAFPFALNQVPNSSDFTNLFDRYRVTKIDLTFSWVRSTATSASPNELRPIIYMFMDEDDASIPLTKNEVFERQAMQRHQFNDARSSVSVTIYPRWIQSRSGVSTNLAPRNSWIDMATPAVQQYGIKGWVENMSTTNPNSISVSGRMHFECAVVR